MRLVRLLSSLRWVKHGTDKVVDDQERITLAFDIYTEEGYINSIKDHMKSHWVKL